MTKTRGGAIKNRIRVLDIGAGMGFQSWQFAKHGFKSFAVDLSPEFLLAGGSLINARNHFERIVADCTVLPFKKGSFEIIFCKEIIHHIGDSLDLLNEISRVASPSALLYVSEPCTSILLPEKMLRKTDRATQVGASHKFYSLNDYIGILRKISPKIHVEGEVLARSHHPLLTKVLLTISKSHKKLVGLFPALSTLLVRAELLLIGGSVELLGSKKMEYEQEIDRDLVIIDYNRINDSLIQFYKEKFIPAVYQAFFDSHKKATATRIELNAYN